MFFYSPDISNRGPSLDSLVCTKYFKMITERQGNWLRGIRRRQHRRKTIPELEKVPASVVCFRLGTERISIMAATQSIASGVLF